MLLGKTVAPPLPWPPAENDTGPKELFKLALGWLKEDKVVRKEREKVTGRVRGPKAEVSFHLSPFKMDLSSLHFHFRLLGINYSFPPAWHQLQLLSSWFDRS